MPDLQARLLEAAVRPFSENAELKHFASDFLEKRITKDADAAAMLERWQVVDTTRRKPLWSIGLWVMVTVVSAGVAFMDFDEIRRLAPWGKWLATGSMFTPLPDASQRVASRLNEAEKLLLFGDLTKESLSERKEALWLSEPENPSYFSDYAGAYISENEKLPPNYFEITKRIDPTNSWFTYLAAAVEAKESVKGKSRKSTRVAGKTVYVSAREWEILDQARLDRALTLLREARDQLKYESYGMEMLRKRLPLLPQGTPIERLDSVGCLAATSVFSSMQLRALADVIYAKGWSFGEFGDLEGFQEFSKDGELFLRRTSDAETGTLVDGLMVTVIANSISESFGYTAEKLGLADDAARWKMISKRLSDRHAGRASRKFMVDGKAVERGTLTGGLVAGSIEMQTRFVENQPLLRDADLEPMRLVEHEFFSRVFSYVLWILMVLCLGFVVSYRFYVASISRRLARRMVDLLHPSDWGWILVVGVVLPFVFVMSINRLTPLGGRAFGMQGTALLMPASHFLGLLLLWLIVPVQVVHWRLTKRANGFGFSKPSWTGWLAVGVAAAFVPMIGWAAISHIGGSLQSLENISKWPWRFAVAIALAGMSALWMAWQASLAMLGRADCHFYRATSSLALVTPYAATLLLIATASIGFKASEHYWFRQDWMSKFDVSNPGWSTYEARVATQMRKELREILGYER
jgi:hypothetical protein